VVLVAPLVGKEEGERAPPPQPKREGGERRAVVPLALVVKEEGRRSLPVKRPVVKEEERSPLPQRKPLREEEGEPSVARDQDAQIPALNQKDPHPELKLPTD